MSIGMLVEMSASHGDRVFLGSVRDGVTFSALAAHAATGARVLRATGATNVAFIGVYGPAFVVALCASALAGLPFAPLNYRLAPDQLAATLDMLEDPVVIADRAYIPAIAGRRVIDVDDWMARVAATTAGAVGSGAVEAQAPALVLFTSGSTAAPKAVILRHSHLVSYVVQTVGFGVAGPEEAALVSVPPYHIAGVGSVLSNLYAGRRIVALPDFAPDAWLDLVRAERVTTAMVVPTMLARIVAHLGGRPAACPTLRAIAYGGARMPRPVIEEALRLFPETGFANAYGLTETSSTVALLGPEDHRAALRASDPKVRARLGSVGRPVPGIDVQVRSDAGMPLPPGCTGQLWVRGAQVSGQYGGTGSTLDDEGWFHTQDRAWMDEHGYLFITGRSDDTIIRGGENIAPAEIEDVLIAHPAVAEVAVVGLPDQEWGQRIAAVVVPVAGERPDAGELRRWVQARLRSSRTPDDVFFATELPRTSTGKLIRRELIAGLVPSPDHSAGMTHVDSGG